MSIAVMGLASFGCVVAETEAGKPVWLDALPVLLVGVVVFLVCTGILMLVSTPRRSRKLAKIFVALTAGLGCGALWILLVGIAVNGAAPEPAVLVVGVVTALVSASLLSLPNRLSTVVGCSAMVIGFHSLALPIAALISVLVGSAQWSPAARFGPAVTAVILGTKFAGDLRIGLSVGGLLVGVVLVFVGDQTLRRRRTRRSRFDLSGPHA